MLNLTETIFLQARKNVLRYVKFKSGEELELPTMSVRHKTSDSFEISTRLEYGCP